LVYHRDPRKRVDEATELSRLGAYRRTRLADLHLEVDRPLWTYTFTIAVQDARTSMLLGSDQVIAASGDLAAPTLAEKIVKMIAAARSTETTIAKKD
jgi:hypothetical protein